jgi:hypothetical protein
MHGLESAVCAAMGIARLRHRSALLGLHLPPDLDIAALVYGVVSTNWRAGCAGDNKERSQQNWRWTLQPQIGAGNRSPEVVLERAIASACDAAGRNDWANQIPVASGLIAGSTDGRRAVDLAHRRTDGAVELIELKIASDTPLYAAVELLGYASAWLLASADPPARRPELLREDRVDLRVLAPAAYYAPFDLRALERAVDDGARRLGHGQGAHLSFAFDVLPEELALPPLPSGPELLALLDQRRPLH